MGCCVASSSSPRSGASEIYWPGKLAEGAWTVSRSERGRNMRNQPTNPERRQEDPRERKLASAAPPGYTSRNRCDNTTTTPRSPHRTMGPRPPRGDPALHITREERNERGGDMLSGHLCGARWQAAGRALPPNTFGQHRFKRSGHLLGATAYYTFQTTLATRV